MSAPQGDEPAVRPAPRYGEYATPEQQRARIVEGGGVPAELAPAPGPSEPPPAAGPAAPGAQHPPVHPPAGPATTAAARPTRTADRIITIALLAYGLLTVVTGLPQMLDFSGFVDTYQEVAGIDAAFTNYAAGVMWGRIAAVILAAGWIATALLSWWAISKRWLSWWIPLVGAIVTFTIASVCLAVPLVTDPGFTQELIGLG